MQLQGSTVSVCMRSVNERRRYNVISSLIGWAHTQSDPCTFPGLDVSKSNYFPGLNNDNFQIKLHRMWKKILVNSPCMSVDVLSMLILLLFWVKNQWSNGQLGILTNMQGINFWMRLPSFMIISQDIFYCWIVLVCRCAKSLSFGTRGPSQ